MQIKHTFLFTLILGLVWTGMLFAFSLGPDPGMNGIFGQSCAASGCHVGNPVNAAGGLFTLAGLPATWNPGETYPLTVTIQRAGRPMSGFQLSVVSDATNQQAGTLTPGNGRVKVICGRSTPPTSIEVLCTTAGAIQYAEHSNASVVTTTFPVNWTAPADTSAGTVRFNVAGNSANGDFSNTGDFIYTRVDRVDPAAGPPPPPPPPVGVSSFPFTLVDRGGMSIITDGGGDLSVGYSRIQPGSGSTTPSGVAIFGLRQSGVVVTETGVPASPLLTSARIYAEVNNTVNTGIAIANPGSQTANISFTFTDSNGDFGTNSFTLGPNQQTAKFLNEGPFNVLSGRASFQGTVSFTSDVPVSLIALRGLFNERTPSEFLLTTLPVTNLATTPGSSAASLPHFAEGAGWTTQIVLVNPTNAALTGTIQFFGQVNSTTAGTPVTVTANGQTASSFPYSIPAKGSFKLVTSGTLPTLVSGSVRVTPSTGATPSSLIVFSYKPAGITVTEAGVPAIQSTAFRMYAEQTAIGGIGAIQTGFAIVNPGSAPVTVNLELTGLDGSSSGQVAAETLPANGKVAKFLHEAFPTLTFPFKGILKISGASGLSVVGLRGRYNERGDFLITTTPPSNEGGTPSAAEQLFPHLVNGGGYTTQFILFSGTAGQASSGTLTFSKPDGTALNLTVN